MSMPLLLWRFVLIFGCAAAISLPVSAQERQGIPIVRFRTDTDQLQRSLYPSAYLEIDAADERQWIAQQDSALVEFWQSSGNSVLALLADFSGFEWQESVIDCYLVRYFPSLGQSDPLILPLGGVRTGELIEAAPSRAALDLNLIYQLARRLLSGAAGSLQQSSLAPYVIRHPLLESSPWRRDLLALHLAMAVAEQVMGKPFAQAAYETPEWGHFVPCIMLHKAQLQSHWPLSIAKPLASWLADEPYESELVLATRFAPASMVSPDEPLVAGVPSGGKLGMGIRIDGGKIVIAALDPARSAAICGLQVNDQIVSVNDGRPGSARKMMELLLDRYPKGGAKVSVLRAGKPAVVIVRPTATKKGEEKKR